MIVVQHPTEPCPAFDCASDLANFVTEVAERGLVSVKPCRACKKLRHNRFREPSKPLHTNRNVLELSKCSRTNDLLIFVNFKKLVAASCSGSFFAFYEPVCQTG